MGAPSWQASNYLLS